MNIDDIKQYLNNTIERLDSVQDRDEEARENATAQGDDVKARFYGASISTRAISFHHLETIQEMIEELEG